MDEKFDEQYGIDPQSHIRGQNSNIPESIDWEKLLQRGSQSTDPNKPQPSLWGFVQDQRNQSEKGPNNG